MSNLRWWQRNTYEPGRSFFTGGVTLALAAMMFWIATRATPWWLFVMVGTVGVVSGGYTVLRGEINRRYDKSQCTTSLP